MSPKFTSLNAGYEHVCGVMTDSSVVCWGGNRNGQADASIGISFESVSAGSRHSCGVKTDGTAVCWGGWADDRMSSAEAARAGGLFGAGAVPEHLADTEFISLSAGNTFTCGIKADNSPARWGKNENGQLDVPEGISFTSVSAGGTHACGITTDDYLLCWGGANRRGLIDQVAKVRQEAFGETFSFVNAGSFETCAIKTDGALFCWGRHPELFPTPPDGSFSSVSSGSRYTCGLKSDGSVACWGDETILPEIDPPAGSYSEVSVGNGYEINKSNG